MTRRTWIILLSLSLSVGVTALMSLLFLGRVAGHMIATGIIAALVCSLAIDNVVARYRRALKQANAALATANQELEARVASRTAELQSLQEQLHTRSRTNTTEGLAAGIGHEIRNPLTALITCLAFLRDEVEDEELREIAVDGMAAAKQINAVCDDLRTLSESEAYGVAYVEDAVDTALRLAGHALGSGTRVIRALEDVPAVQMSPSRLCQVLLNLLVNAARDGGAESVRVSARQVGDRVAIEVRDNGTGMTADVVAQAFNPFFTTHKERGGTGMGLPVCKNLVESARGAITLQSEAGEGTLVTLWLPAQLREDRAVA